MVKKLTTFIKNNMDFIIILLVIGLCFIKFDYVIYSPGGKVDLTERIKIDGEYKTAGKLNMAFVTMRDATLPTAIAALIIPNWDMYPNEEVVYSDTTYEETLEIDRLSMKASQDLSTIMAYKKAGKKIDISGYHSNVIFVTEDAQTDIKPLDEIIRINGNEMGEFSDIGDYISLLNPGDKVEIDVLRDGKEKKCSAVIYDVDGASKIGVGILMTYDFKTDPEIKIESKKSESGASGGLMTTLAIYNKLTKEDITKGRDIMGTGTIQKDGTVGEIDGVKYKLLGSKGSDIFLCPKENEAEALRVKKKFKLDIEIKAVGTLDEAIEYLNAN